MTTTYLSNYNYRDYRDLTRSVIDLMVVASSIYPWKRVDSLARAQERSSAASTLLSAAAITPDSYWVVNALCKSKYKSKC